MLTGSSHHVYVRMHLHTTLAYWIYRVGARGSACDLCEFRSSSIRNELLSFKPSGVIRYPHRFGLCLQVVHFISNYWVLQE